LRAVKKPNKKQRKNAERFSPSVLFILVIALNLLFAMLVIASEARQSLFPKASPAGEAVT
jgi:hypothetical protein